MAAIRAVVKSASTAIRFTEADISARYLRAGSVMALLIARVDPYTTRLVARWRNNKMIRYLHTTSNSFIEGLSYNMFQRGAYKLIPTAHARN